MQHKFTTKPDVYVSFPSGDYPFGSLSRANSRRTPSLREAISLASFLDAINLYSDQRAAILKTPGTSTSVTSLVALTDDCMSVVETDTFSSICVRRSQEAQYSLAAAVLASLRQAIEPMAFIIPVMRLDTGAWFLGSPCIPRIALIATTPASRAPSSSSPQPAIAITLSICRQSIGGDHQVARHPVFRLSWCGTINRYFSSRVRFPYRYLIRMLIGTRCFFLYSSTSSAFKMVHDFEWFLRMAFKRCQL